MTSVVMMPLAVKLPLPLVEEGQSFHPLPLEGALLPVVEAGLLLLEAGLEVPAMVLL